MRRNSVAKLIVGFLVFDTAFVALAPAAARAACAFWDLSGSWTIHQGNNIDVALTLKQSPLDTGSPGKIYDGTARYGSVVGRVKEGKVTGNKLWLVVAWENATEGRYEGQVGPNGELSGQTWDVANPAGKWKWHERDGRNLKCGAPQAAAPDVICDQYAKYTLSQVKYGVNRKCGFTGARWSPDYDQHWRWCRGLNGDQTLPNAEKEARQVALNGCEAFCLGYANQAIAAARENERLACGFTGPRWSDDEDGSTHFPWCQLTVARDQAKANAETAARAAALAECKQAKPYIEKPEVDPDQMKVPLPYKLKRQMLRP